MHPFLKSESLWKLNVIYKGIVSQSVKPEKKSVASIFQIGLETVKFFSTEQMSPYDFDHFTLTIIKCSKADGIKIGITIL